MNRKIMILLLALVGVALLAAAVYAKRDSSRDKSLKRAWLGVSTESVDYDDAERWELPVEYGAMITDVVRKSAADQAGLEEDDIIVSFNGKKVTDTDDLSDMIEDAMPGDQVKIGIYRDEKPMDITATLGEQSARSKRTQVYTLGNNWNSKWNKNWNKNWNWSSDNDGRYIGVSIEPISDQLAEYFGVKSGEGLLVTEVWEDSPAEKAGLKAGDVVTAVDKEDIWESRHLIEAVDDAREGDTLTLTVVRNKAETTVKVVVDEYSDRDSRRRGELMHRLPSIPAIPPIPPIPPIPSYFDANRDYTHHYTMSDEELAVWDDVHEKIAEARAGYQEGMADFHAEMADFQSDLSEMNAELVGIDQEEYARQIESAVKNSISELNSDEFRRSIREAAKSVKQLERNDEEHLYQDVR